jgi:hypothetical protein
MFVTLTVTIIIAIISFPWQALAFPVNYIKSQSHAHALLQRAAYLCWPLDDKPAAAALSASW